MNIYNILKKDHQKVSNIFDQILSTKSMSKREVLFKEVKIELLLHSKTEEATFDSALKGHEETKEIFHHAKNEHKEIEEYLEKLSKASLDREEWIELFGEFKHSILHHVKEEDIFKKAKKILTAEQEKHLAIEMDEMKKSIELK